MTNQSIMTVGGERSDKMIGRFSKEWPLTEEELLQGQGGQQVQGGRPLTEVSVTVDPAVQHAAGQHCVAGRVDWFVSR